MSGSERWDVVVVGGGIIGLATARRVLAARPGARVVVVDKEPELASHQSARNSGVIHAGIYYPAGSVKARLCREGKAELERFATERGIPFERSGKLVVAVDESELGRLADLRKRAEANGVPVEEVDGRGIRAREPHVVGVRALWSPGTGIVDFRRVALAYADDVRARGGEIRVATPARAVSERADEVVVTTPAGEVRATAMVACAGLQSDRVAALGTGRPDDLHVVPFRGDYYTLRPHASHLVRGLVYPVPDPRFPFLGVHFTRRIDGDVWLGPNAVLALAREGYRRRDVAGRDLVALARFGGFWRLARRHVRTGATEVWRDLSKRAFLAELRRYVPALEGRDMVFGPSGIRAQNVDRSGALVDDFAFSQTRRVLHVRNAPSPGATASLAIGRVVADRVLERLD